MDCHRHVVNTTHHAPACDDVESNVSHRGSVSHVFRARIWRRWVAASSSDLLSFLHLE